MIRVDYNTEFVEIWKWVEVTDVESGKVWFCRLVPYLTKEMCETAVEKSETKEWKISSFSNDGDVWVHTPFGGAILGRMVGDEFGFYENGVLKRCKVKKILS